MSAREGLLFVINGVHFIWVSDATALKYVYKLYCIVLRARANRVVYSGDELRQRTIVTRRIPFEKTTRRKKIRSRHQLSSHRPSRTRHPSTLRPTCMIHYTFLVNVIQTVQCTREVLCSVCCTCITQSTLDSSKLSVIRSVSSWFFENLVVI